MTKNNKKISFKDYYQNLGNLQASIRNKICGKLNISEKTFYNRMEKGFSYADQLAINEITGQPLETLFPQERTKSA